MEPKRDVDAENGHWEEQPWYCVQFDEDSPPVMMAIEDPSVLDNEAQKEALIESAWDFHCRGVWARENSNPQFIRNLAGDFQKSIPVPNIIARAVVSQLLDIYVERLEREVEEKGEAVVDENATHLTIERSGPGEINVVVDPPEGWDQLAVKQVTEDVSALMATPDEHLLSWYGFSEWMWTTQLARALGDLEDELGTDVLEELPADQFYKALFDRIRRSDDSGLEASALIQRYSDMIAGTMIEAVANESHELWMLERFLALRLHPPKSAHPGKSGIIAIDFASLLEVVGRQPREAYQLPPRRFEELIGHIFERFGYDVELTAESRDGGYDISAVRRAETDVRLLIECKRYTPPNKVGRPILQRLSGVLNDRAIQATKGILATTSTFTSDALKYLEMNRWRLEGRDLEGILDWIRRACGKA
jgi:restriction system protein